VLSDQTGQADAFVFGCPSGVDFEVLHSIGNAEVVLRAEDGRQWPLQRAKWQAAVFEFADQVSALYASSSPKRPSSDDKAGFKKFVAEWKRRRGQPLGHRASAASMSASVYTRLKSNKAVFALCGVMSAALVLLDLYSVVLNATNHTGLPVTWIGAAYAATFAGALALLNLGEARSGVDRRLAWSLLAVSVVGLANILLLDGLNVMMGYERWLSKGMPSKPF
jgi:hypothetical protein